MPFIEVVQPDESEGRLKEIYTDLLESRGKLAEVHKIQSLNPESIVKHMDLYVHLMFGKSPLKRYQREMIAVVVSMANDCEYCQTHHGAALNHFWKDDAKLEAFKKDYRSIDLSEKDLLLCKYSQQLTKKPSPAPEALVNKMKVAGISERELLDSALIIGYFNFVNRIVLGLGVNLEKDKGEGYKYD